MTRRNFLSMVPCAVLSAVATKKTYVFLDGLWRPESIQIMRRFWAKPVNQVLAAVQGKYPEIAVDALFTYSVASPRIISVERLIVDGNDIPKDQFTFNPNGGILLANLPLGGRLKAARFM